MARKKKTVDLDRDNGVAPGIIAKTKKRLVVAGGRSHPALTAAVAEALGTEEQGLGEATPGAPKR